MKKPKLGFLLINLVALSATIFVTFQLIHLTYRLQDTRERNTITNDVASMKRAIKTKAAQQNGNISPEEVEKIVESSQYVNPHTKKAYTYVGYISDYKYLTDGEITYGVGICEKNNPASYFAYRIDMRRVHESTASCTPITS